MLPEALKYLPLAHVRSTEHVAKQNSFFFPLMSALKLSTAVYGPDRPALRILLDFMEQLDVSLLYPIDGRDTITSPPHSQLPL